MRIISRVADLQAQSRAWRAGAEPVSLVPTMGALHDGHLDLVRRAREGGARVVVSIFVNPLQFGPGEDFASYPRDLQRDLDLLEAAGVDVVFNPGVDEMYPPGFATRVGVGEVGEPLEGEARPGHFEGVATVVARLLGAALADRAYFGQKDAQQLAVVRQVVRDLAIPVEIVACPTAREADGLAMSSRNRYLGGQDRRHAVALVQALAEAQALHHGGVASPAQLEAVMRQVLDSHPGVEVEYARVVDPVTFRAPQGSGPALAVIAARVGPARLIDNALVGGDELIKFRVAAPAAASV